jgi:hypothetical protein
MKAFVAIAATAAVLASVPAQAQYYPYNSYDRHSVPANNYARGYNQGSANAYAGMAAGGNMFMNGVIASTAPPPVYAVPPPVYSVPPTFYAPGAVPLPPVGYGLVPNPYGIPYVVPYFR